MLQIVDVADVVPSTVVTADYAIAYLSSDMANVIDYHGAIIGPARIVGSWPNANSAISSRMYQVECRIDGRLYTGRSLGAMMLWRGRVVKEHKKSGFQLLARPESNPKAAKGMKRGVMTFVMHLAPADISGFEVCAGRTEACTELCLNKAGRGRMDSTQAARIRKTRWYFNDRDAFMAALYADIAKAVRYAERKSYDAAIRLNCTSDIPWHRVPVAGKACIMDCFPTTQFYDYCKIVKRLLRETLPANYHLTFSAAENNAADCTAVLQAGGSVAVVFRDRALVERLLLSGSYTLGGITAPLVDGDETDLRYLDPAGSIIALYAKGPIAKRDQSGFVRDC